MEVGVQCQLVAWSLDDPLYDHVVSLVVMLALLLLLLMVVVWYHFCH